MADATIPNKIYDNCVDALPSLHGKMYAITGTTSGTGYWTAAAAVKRGAAVVYLLNRPSVRSATAAEMLRALAESWKSSTEIVSIDCDLQAFTSVRSAAAEIERQLVARGGGLDGLLNNAGVMGVPDTRTVDGFDVQMQTNHLSHFLLTALLMPALEAGAMQRGEARVVQHSSGARGSHRATKGSTGALEAKFFAQCPAGTLGGDSLGKGFNRYHQTKLSNSVFAMALHEHLLSAGSAVKSICAEPGFAATSLIGNLQAGHASEGKAPLPPMATFPGMQSAADGACPLVEAAFARFVDGGDFLMPGDVVEKAVVGMPVKCMTAGRPTPTSQYMREQFQMERLTMDRANHRTLWAASLEAVGTEPVAAARPRL